MPNSAKQPGGARMAAGPNCSFPILKQGKDIQSGKPGVRRQLAVLPTRQSPVGADPKSTVARSQQPYNEIVGKLLARRQLPWDGTNAIESQQPEIRAEPQITVRRLRDCCDPAFEKTVADGPRGVRVLIDVEGRVQGRRNAAARQERTHHEAGPPGHAHNYLTDTFVAACLSVECPYALAGCGKTPVPAR